MKVKEEPEAMAEKASMDKQYDFDFRRKLKKVIVADCPKLTITSFDRWSKRLSMTLETWYPLGLAVITGQIKTFDAEYEEKIDFFLGYVLMSTLETDKANPDHVCKLEDEIDSDCCGSRLYQMARDFC